MYIVTVGQKDNRVWTQIQIDTSRRRIIEGDFNQEISKTKLETKGGETRLSKSDRCTRDTNIADKPTQTGTPGSYPLERWR